MNAHHIMTKNFENYGKGPGFRNVFKLFGETLFTVDSDAWRQQRAFYVSLFIKKKSSEMFLAKVVQKKVNTCLVPVLDHVESQGSHVDLQDLFSRLSFDITCSLFLGDDPKSIAINFPEIECQKAYNKAEKFAFYRHIVPRRIWELLTLLRIGGDKKMAEEFEAFDQYLRETIASRRVEKTQKNDTRKEEDVDDDDVLTTLIMKGEEYMHG